MTDLLSPTNYGRNVPKNARSTGAVELFVPLNHLLPQFARRTLLDSLSYLRKGKGITDIERHLEDEGVSADLLQLNEIANCTTPPDLKWDGTSPGLLKLQRQVDDFKSNDGSWRESLTAYLPDTGEFEARLQKQVTTTVSQFHARFGVEAALQVIAFIETKISNKQKQREQAGLPSITDLIRSITQPEKRVRTLIKRPGRPVQLAGKINDRIPIPMLYSARHRKQIQKFVDAGSELQKARFQRLLCPVLSDATQRVLGDGDSLGWLQEFTEVLTNSQSVFDMVTETLKADKGSSLSASASRLPLVEGLNTVLDRQSGHTVLDEFRQRASTVGRTPRKLAQHLLKDGVTVDGRTLLHHQWSDVPAQTLSDALLVATQRFLGCHDIHAPLNPSEPKTAADAIAQLSILHPVFRHRLQVMLRLVVERSTPYAEFDRMHRERTNVQSFLFCDPSHRKQLVEMLSLQTVTVAEARRVDTYATAHPYSMLLLQHRICAALGTMPAVQRWAQLSNRMIRNGQIQPLEKRCRFPEVRMLTERVRDDADCRKLFEAAKLAGAIVETESTNHWTVTQSDLRLTELFAPSKWVPRRLSAANILSLLKDDSDFLAFLIGKFLSVRNLSTVLEQMAQEHNAGAVAERLAKLGVLRSNEGRYSVNTTFDSFPRRAPREIIRRLQGKTKGLSEEVFLTALANHDLLYNVLFFAVMDAWQLNEIPTHKVPDSIKQQTIIL